MYRVKRLTPSIVEFNPACKANARAIEKSLQKKMQYRYRENLAVRKDSRGELYRFAWRKDNLFRLARKVNTAEISFTRETGGPYNGAFLHWAGIEESGLGLGISNLFRDPCTKAVTTAELEFKLRQLFLARMGLGLEKKIQFKSVEVDYDSCGEEQIREMLEN